MWGSRGSPISLQPPNESSLHLHQDMDHEVFSLVPSLRAVSSPSRKPGRRPLRAGGRGATALVTSRAAACGGRRPLPVPAFVTLRRARGSPNHSRGSGYRPSAVTQKRHQRRPKGEAAKQRASEQPIFTHLSFERACMKMWCLLNRDSANK